MSNNEINTTVNTNEFDPKEEAKVYWLGRILTAIAETKKKFISIGSMMVAAVVKAGRLTSIAIRFGSGVTIGLVILAGETVYDFSKRACAWIKEKATGLLEQLINWFKDKKAVEEALEGEYIPRA